MPWGGIFGRGSPKLKVEVKNPNGNAPIPKDMWKPPSPNAKPNNYKNKYVCGIKQPKIYLKKNFQVQVQCAALQVLVVLYL